MSAPALSRLATGLTLGAAATLFLVSANPAAADDCVALGGSIVACECRINSAVQRTGTYNLDETLHLLAGGVIDAKNGGITINVTAMGGCGGDVLLDTGSEIRANDDVPNANASASDIAIDATGSLVMQHGSAIFAENRTSGGVGGDIELTLGGNATVHSQAGNAGAVISSSRTGGANAGGLKRAGDIQIQTGGTFTLKPETHVAANDVGGDAGDISIEAGGHVRLDGVVSSGPSRTVLGTKLTGFVLDGGNTTQRGGKIDIVSTSGVSPGFFMTAHGIVVSQGQDPSSDAVHVEACGVIIDGMVASVSKKSNGSLGNSPVVVIRSGDILEVDGTNLGVAGASLGRVRADYIIGEANVEGRVDLFATNDIVVLGPAAGTIFTVSSDGGSATNQPGGDVTVISLEGQVTASGMALQASGLASGGTTPAGGSDGGTIAVLARRDVILNGATLQAIGDFNSMGGYGTGGTIEVRSHAEDVSWTSGTGDVRPTGISVPLANRGTITLTHCGVLTQGATYPSNGMATTPSTALDCSDPTGPALPPGEAQLPDCS